MKTVTTIVAAALVVFAADCFAQGLAESKIENPRGPALAANDTFGMAVSISDDTVLIGATGDATSGTASGAAYVFVRTTGGWVPEAELRPTDLKARGFYGQAVSIWEDTAVIGAPSDDDVALDSGAVYVFTRSNGIWTQQAKIKAQDAEAGDEFGWSVQVQGDTLVVGADSEDDFANNSGAAYVFRRMSGSWIQQAKLKASDPRASAGLGGAVSIDGDTILAGASFDSEKGYYSGAVYVFVNSGGVWTQQAKLFPTDASELGVFGMCVSLSNSTAAISKFGDDEGGNFSGATYIFNRSGTNWTQQAKLKPAVTSASLYFGTSVGLGGDWLAIGAAGDDTNATDAGAAYLFKRTNGTWSEVHKVTASDGAYDDQFGSYVAISGTQMLVGAPVADDPEVDSGSAYVYSFAADTAAGQWEIYR